MPQQPLCTSQDPSQPVWKETNHKVQPNGNPWQPLLPHFNTRQGRSGEEEGVRFCFRPPRCPPPAQAAFSGTVTGTIRALLQSLPSKQYGPSAGAGAFSPPEAVLKCRIPGERKREMQPTNRTLRPARHSLF
mmetsp:Transcript_3576/g.8547  ORF Transcript_3576/g.8547 Transcript_3576/m.8547 type:complete len:132 (+) Transcript_3576:180-575(+)